ncbi:MAG TPA: phosphonate C-P lyase system protein PhnG [Candidatus Dormibacteraeota bacterium]|nr:phosphonate C-P lyase system protein PhnG [Candidatus Dormibacteraeota bacterium]
MTPERRSEGLAAAVRVHRDEVLQEAVAVVRRSRVEVIRPPAAGSVMLELDSPVGSFCLTEVVVTSAEVRVDGGTGWACVLGFDEEAAVAAAILDGSAGPTAERLAEAALTEEAEQAEEEARMAAATRVDG